MTTITGRNATLDVRGDDGEWHWLGSLDEIFEPPDLSELINAAMLCAMLIDGLVMAINATSATCAAGRLAMPPLGVKHMRFLIYNDKNRSHGGERRRRRKHGGCWVKTTGRKKPPRWLVYHKAGIV